MDFKIFTIYDSITDAYMTPFFLRNVPHAQRVFRSMVNNQNEQMATSPGDFTLFEIGHWTDEDGNIVPIDLKSHGTGLSYLDEK